MSHKHPFLFKLPVVAVAACLLTIVSLGGCPVAQQPTTPPADDGSASSAPDFAPLNQDRGSRPIPPLPVDDGSQQDDFGTLQPGTPTVPTVPDEPEVPDQQQPPVLRVTVLGPNSNLELRRDEPVEIEYRVDGDAQNIELIYDLEGGQAGVVAQSGLNVEGKVVFSTGDPGIYSFSIRATSSDTEVIQSVPAIVTVVGDMTIIFTEPARNLIVRPNVPVPVAYTVATLASSINAEVFVDPDLTVEGDETRVFSSILKSVSETFNTQALDLGVDYTIYVEVTDSVGQSSGRVMAPNTFRIVPIPTINVTAPDSAATIDPGDRVQVDFVANDIENIATITVFVDTDTDFNNGVDVLAADLPISETTFVVDTSDFVAGTYHFGAWVGDPDTGDVFRWDYAPGLRSIAGITITAPAGDRTVRTPNTVELRWRAIFTASEFSAHQVVVAPDFNNDGVPDGPLQVLADGFDPAPASNSHPISTIGLKGRYLVGVRLIDNNNQEVVSFAAGDVIVLNDPPTVQINQPADFVAVRPGTPESQIRMDFFVGDTEGRNELLDIAVVVARDDDEPFGVPDGPPVLTVRDPSFRLGANGGFIFDADQLQPLINDPEHPGFGWFTLGVRVIDDAGQEALMWTPGLYVDDVVPTISLDAPSAQLTIKDRIGTLDVQVSVVDTSPTLVRVMLDLNLNPNGQDQVLVDWTFFDPNQTQQFEIDLTTLASGYYLYYLEVGDPVELLTHYLPEGVLNPSLARALWIRDRTIGVIEVASFDDSPNGAILQGFNFNDLGGSSMERVADVDNDGDDEFIIVSRYGKPFLLNNSIGVGFGEAFLIYGNDGNNNINDPRRLRGAQTLNAVGRGSIKGLAFPGIRIPLNATAEGTGMTEGISDVTVVEDMDGDELPEIIFSFPRVESINLGEDVITVQHPELLPDLPGMGNLEYDAYNPMTGWTSNVAQFTRGGIVVVSSHNSNIS
ncbi:MAG: hypothetical protein IID33_04695, partial [Planctomycetes bacterium]|nr:hypothetical protein [Planctomycetota bacterium]